VCPVLVYIGERKAIHRVSPLEGNERRSHCPPQRPAGTASPTFSMTKILSSLCSAELNDCAPLLYYQALLSGLRLKDLDGFPALYRQVSCPRPSILAMEVSPPLNSSLESGQPVLGHLYILQVEVRSAVPTFTGSKPSLTVTRGNTFSMSG
jgi:hypothetical protein